MEIKFVSILFLLFSICQVFGLDTVLDGRLDFAPKLPCSCRVSVAKKIIKGRVASSQTYPWLVSIQKKGANDPLQAHGCGASVVNENWLVTAAHCFVGVNPSTLQLAYGPTKALSSMKQYLEIDKVVLHPKFKQSLLSLENDIALIKVVGSIPFSKDILPACLGTAKVTTYPGALGIAGWGSETIIKINKKTGQSLTPFKSVNSLKEASVFDFTSKHVACRGKNANKMICTFNQAGDSACKGDSGSPLHATQGGKTYVIGVSSFAQYRDDTSNKDLINLCDSGSIYTRLSNYMDWIREYTGYNYC